MKDSHLSCKLEILNEILLSPVKLMNRLKNKHKAKEKLSFLYSKHCRSFDFQSLIYCRTSCLLISLVENVLFWWTSSVSDHSVLFLRLVGVGPMVLLLALRDIPGDFVSPRNDIDWRKRKVLFIDSLYLCNMCLKHHRSRTLTWIVWPKRRTAPFFEGDIKLTRDETLASGRTRLLLGSLESKKLHF